MSENHFAMSIRGRLLLLAFAMVLPVVLVWGIYVAGEAREAREAANVELQAAAAHVADDLALAIQTRRDMLARMAERPLVRALDPKRCDPLIRDYVALHPEYTTLGIRDREGNIVCSYLPNPPPQSDVVTFPWFREGLAREGFNAGNAFLGRPSGRWLSVMTSPIRDDAGKVSGLVVLSVDLLPLSAQVTRKVPPHIVVAATDRNRTLLVRSVDPEKWLGQPAPQQLVAMVGQRTDGLFEAPGVDGKQRLYAIRPVPGVGWRVATSMPEEDVVAPVHQLVLKAALVSAGVLLLLVVLAWRMSDRIARPIRALAATATDVAAGQDGARAAVDGPREVANVARQFNTMLDTIARQNNERLALTGHYESLLRNARDIVLLIDADGRIVEANDAAAKAYGFSRDELSGMHVSDVRAKEAAEALAAEWKAAEAEHGVLFETVHRRRDGSTFPVEVSSRAFTIEGKSYRQSFIRDISERRRVQQVLVWQEARFRALAEQSLVGIYVIEGGRITYANPRAAAIFGYAQDETIGQSFEHVVAPEEVDRIREHIRQRVSGEVPAAQYEFRGRRKDGSSVMVGINARSAMIEGRRVVMGVLQDITDKLRAEEDIRNHLARINRMIDGTVDAISNMVELRDPYTAGHERRVGLIAAAIAGEMGRDAEFQHGMRLAGAVHDVGKLVVPAEILSKPRRLTPIEYDMVREHAQQGYQVLKDIDSPWPIAEVARQHHERMDGSGYPRGLKGDEILIEARILAVADVIESMGSHRPYRPSLGIEPALDEIGKGRGRLYDPDVADACIRLFREKGYVLPA